MLFAYACYVDENLFVMIYATVAQTYSLCVG